MPIFISIAVGLLSTLHPPAPLTVCPLYPFRPVQAFAGGTISPRPGSIAARGGGRRQAGAAHLSVRLRLDGSILYTYIHIYIYRTTAFFLFLWVFSFLFLLLPCFLLLFLFLLIFSTFFVCFSRDSYFFVFCFCCYFQPLFLCAHGQDSAALIRVGLATNFLCLEMITLYFSFRGVLSVKRRGRKAAKRAISSFLFSSRNLLSRARKNCVKINDIGHDAGGYEFACLFCNSCHIEMARHLLFVLQNPLFLRDTAVGRSA